MNQKLENWEYYAIFGYELLFIGHILCSFYNIALYTFFAMLFPLCGFLWRLKNLNNNRPVVKIVKFSLYLTICLCIGAGILAYQITPWRKFSREPPSVYRALVEKCKQLLEQENLLDMDTDSRRSLLDAAERSGVKDPWSKISPKIGDVWVGVDPDNIYFPNEILHYSTFEVGIIRNHVSIQFINNKPESFLVYIQHFPNNDNKWLVTQIRGRNGIGVLWEGNL